MKDLTGDLRRLLLDFFSIDIHQRNFGAFATEKTSRSGSYTASASGYHRYFAVQSARHKFLYVGGVFNRLASQKLFKAFKWFKPFKRFKIRAAPLKSF